MKKRILSLALALCMMLSVMPTSYAGNGVLTLGDSDVKQESPTVDTPVENTGPSLTLDGIGGSEDEPNEHSATEEPVYGILTSDGFETDNREEEPDEPVYGVLTPDEPIEDETDNQYDWENNEPTPGVLYFHCDLCGYLDGNHAEDCPTQQTQEKPVVQPTVKPATPVVDIAPAEEEIPVIEETPVVNTYSVEMVSAPQRTPMLNIARNASAYSTLTLMATGDEGEDPYAVMPVEDERVDNSSVVTTKEVKKDSQGNLVTDADGNYIIRLEAYVTGQTTTTETVRADDMDIILILDTSREMVEKEYSTIEQWESWNPNPYNWTDDQEEVYNKSRENTLYYDVDGSENTESDRYPVTVSPGWGYNQYTATYNNGTTDVPINNFQDQTYWFKTTTTMVTGDDGGAARLAALKTAAVNFIDAIAPDDATENDRRVALISYNSSSTVLTGALSGGAYAAQNNAVDAALRPVTDEKELLKAEINALTVNTSAAAYCETALYDAKQIFQNGNTSVPADRPRIVILLSAGVFGPSGQLNNSSTDGYTAMDMIWLSVILKTARGTTVEPDFGSNFYGFADRDAYSFSNTYGSYDGCGATVYCVGLGMPTTEPIGAYYTTDTGTIASRINEVMYRVSSHRPDGTHTSKNMYNPWESLIQSPSYRYDYWEGTYPDALTRNVNKLNSSYTSYFLTADDASELSGIFNTISDSIQSGSASVTLDTTTTVTDVVSDYFQLPKDNNGNVITSGIKVYTADYTSSKTWAADVESNLKPEVGDNSVTVSGFDFSKNYVDLDAENGRDENDPSKSGNFYGRKLIIEIPFKVADDFLGGVEVPTNTTGSAIVNGGVVYEEFDPPTVTIPVKPENINIDWSNDIETNDFDTFLTNDVDLNVSGDEIIVIPSDSMFDGVNNAYVDVVFTITDADNNEIGSYTIYAPALLGPTDDETEWKWKPGYNSGVVSNLLEDQTYTITCSIGGKTISGSTTAYIDVYMPEVTFRDSTIYLSQTPVYELVDAETGTQIGNYQSVVWKHDGTPAPAAMGAAPVLVYDYDPDEAAFDTCTDVNVTATIQNTGDVTDYVTFVNGQSSHNGPENEAEFTVHVMQPTYEVENTTIHLGTTVDLNDFVTPGEWEKCCDDADPDDDAPEVTYTLTEGQNIVGEGYTTDSCATITVTPSIKATDVKTFMVHVLKPTFAVETRELWADYEADVTLTMGVDLAEGKYFVTADWIDADHDEPAAVTEAPVFENSQFSFVFDIGEAGVYEMGDADQVTKIQSVTWNNGVAESTTTFTEGSEPAFIIHINKFDLTVTKDWGETEAVYQHDVIVALMCGDTKICDVVVPKSGSITITGLICGKDYTLDECENWAWRFTNSVEYSSSAKATHTHTPDVSASAPNDNCEVAAEITNTQNKFQWFDAIAVTVKNIFGKGGI